MNQIAKFTCRGVSLVEMLCCVAVSATTLSSALPTLVDHAQRHRLQSAADQLRTDLQLARTAAMQRSEPVRLTWQALPGLGACYVIHTGGANQCGCGADLRPSCAPGVQTLRSAALPLADRIGLSAATRTLLFDARRGTVTPTATLKLSDDRGRALHLVVNIMGRVRTCSASAQMTGIKPC